MAEDRMERSAEEESQIPVEQLGVSSEVSPQTLSMIKNILDALAHEDAIKIFIYAKNGITNSTVAIRDMGLTQKRYYTRLKLLLDAGILEKREQGYRYTFLGTILHQMSGSFKAVLEQKDRLELANKLRKSKTLSLEEKKNLMNLITPTALTEVNLQDMLSPVRMVDNYEEMIKNSIELIEKTERNLYVASRYSDIRVIEAILRASNRGVEMRFLSAKLDLSQRLNVLRALFSPNTFSLFLKMTKELSSIIKQIELPYSFIISDEKYVAIEVPHPIKEEFYLGFIFQNEVVCKKIINVFEDLWNKGNKPL